MIQVNLLPDIKSQYLRAQRTKRFFVVVAMLISASAVAIVFLMASFVFVVQGQHSKNLKNDIDSNIAELKKKENLAQVLTVQNQLEALPELHGNKPVTSRMFEYLRILANNNISLSDVEMNFANNEQSVQVTTSNINITGTAKNFKDINTFADTLKNALFTSSSAPQPTKAFKNVAVSQNRDSEVAMFEVVMEFDPLIFDFKEKNVKMTVPNITSSPSVTERPTSLFNKPAEEDQTGGSN